MTRNPNEQETSRAGQTNRHAAIPLRRVGPVRVDTGEEVFETEIPLATYETPLFASVHRGARTACAAGGIRAVLLDERMTRSVLFEAPDAATALEGARIAHERMAELRDLVKTTSRFAELVDIHHQIAGNLLFLRFEFTTGDAAGHNMVTLASEALMNRLIELCPRLAYESVSGNYCCDKKATAVNGILGRGKSVAADLTIPGNLCRRFLKTTPEKIVQLNLRKNLVGTLLAGGVRTANAHYANMLLAFYLATGQDAANIIEGSQGITQAEVRNGALWFSVTLPHLIVGTVGNGKGLPHVEEELQHMGCLDPRPPGENARRLAFICAAAVLCGELSLMAALTNPGELMAAHKKMERK